MTRINLCLASQLFYPHYAGGAMRYQRYLPGLRERQVFTRVFTGTPSQERMEKFNADGAWQAYQPGQHLPLQTVQGTPVHRVRLADRRSWQRVMQYGQALVHFCQQQDVQPDVIQFLPLPPWSIPALYQLRRLKIPLAYAYNLLSSPQNSWRHRIRHLAAWRLQLPLIDCIIVQSNLMCRTLRDAGLTGRIEVIPNGVDAVRFKPAQNAADRTKVRRQLGIDQKAPVIVYVGAIEPRKGADLLFSAWARFAPGAPQAHLVIVGPRLDVSDPTLTHLQQKIEGLVAASATQNRVHFVGRVADVESYLQTADLFLFPSRREGLPNVMLEAMAAGLPVITTPFIGLSDELGRPGEHYLLAEHDPDHLCHLMQQVLANESLALNLGKEARHWIETHMDVRSVLDRYAALYGELAGQAKTI